MSNDELLDIVDDNDNVIGQKKRSEVHAAGMHNFRVVNLFLKNKKGELWIPRRTAHKQIAPLALDMSMGGHVEAGETYETAFKRETMEELGIDVDKAKLHFLGHVTPHKDDVYCFGKVWEIESEEVPKFNPADFSEYYWLTPQALLDRITAGDKAKSDLPKLVRIFYSLK